MEAGIAVAAALSRQGLPYVWAAEGPDQFDCSSLMQWSWRQAGVEIPRNSAAQAGLPEIPLDELQPGDLVTYYSPVSHVGMYVGDGLVLHASMPGVPIKVVPLDAAGPNADRSRRQPLTPSDPRAGVRPTVTSLRWPVCACRSCPTSTATSTPRGRRAAGRAARRPRRPAGLRRLPRPVRRHPRPGVRRAAVRQFTALRTAGDFHGLREFNRSLWDSTPDPLGTLTDVVSARYREVLDAVGPDALLTLGNVDVAAIWNDVAGGDAAVPGRRRGRGRRPPAGLRRRRVSEAGRGAARRRTRSGSRWCAPPTTTRRRSCRSGPVDVLCSHIPPRIGLLRYDTVPARMEMYGPGLLEAIDAHQPRWAVFGHVHQPISPRARRGRTECVNVGHFQRHPRAFEITLSVTGGWCAADAPRPG